MSWQDQYQGKLISAKQAAKLVKNGDVVVVGSVSADPQDFLQALVDRREELRDVQIVHMRTMRPLVYAEEGMEKHFRHNSLFVGQNRTTMEAVLSGRADFTPCHYSEIPHLFLKNYMAANVVILHLSPPDNHGYCSYGTFVGYMPGAAEKAEILIAEINEQMPRTFGQRPVHVSEVHHIIEASYPLVSRPREPVSPVFTKIGENIAGLIEDGATLQTGGSIADGVLAYLTDRKDLGIHTELLGDTAIDLVRKGVVTNQRKNINRGACVSTFVDGTKELFEFVHQNPMVEVHRVDYTNDPFVIAQNDRVVAINSAIEVDLMGQINSEAIGNRTISGVGGQFDFARGAARSKGGKFVIGLPSTARDGKISRIVPQISLGAPVTVPRHDVDYVVTEFGVAHLRGKPLIKRAESLINIAHPDFRKQIADGFRQIFPRWV